MNSTVQKFLTEWYITQMNESAIQNFLKNTMEVNKFGGASIRDSSGVKNLLSILKTKKRKAIYCCFCNGKDN